MFEIKVLPGFTLLISVYAISTLTYFLGGFSFVFFVRDTNTNEHYALKRMLVNSRADLENCTQEIEIMVNRHCLPPPLTS